MKWHVLNTRIHREKLRKASLIAALCIVCAATALSGIETLAAAPTLLGRWRRISPPYGLRCCTAFAYDSDRRLLVSVGSDLKSTYTYTGTGPFTLKRENPPTSPPPQAIAWLAYHPPTKTVVMFGGGFTRGERGETWLWDGRTWTHSLGAGPPARKGESMAFDPITGSVILFGGDYLNPGDFKNPATLLNDTWEWDGTAWHALAPRSSPPPLVYARLAYSAAARELILFGGYVGEGKPYMGTTWAWDGTNWLKLSLHPSPPARFNASMAAAPDGGLVLLFGGQGSHSHLGDTWIFTGKWTQDTKTPSPEPRTQAVLVPDLSSRSFILFGGAVVIESENVPPVLEDWAWGPY